MTQQNLKIRKCRSEKDAEGKDECLKQFFIFKYPVFLSKTQVDSSQMYISLFI